MGVFDQLAQQFMQRPFQQRDLDLQQKAMQQHAQQNQQRMMMQQQQMQQEQARYEQEVARERHREQFDMAVQFNKLLQAPDTPAGTRAAAISFNGILPPEIIQAGVQAANEHLLKKQEERDEERGIKAYDAGLTPAAPPPQVVPPSQEMQSMGRGMQMAPFMPGGNMAGAMMQAPQVIPPQHVLKMGGVPYYQRQKPASIEPFTLPPGHTRYGPDGRPVVTAPGTSPNNIEMVTVPGRGVVGIDKSAMRPGEVVPGTEPAKVPSAGERGKLAALENVIQQVETMGSFFKPEFVGPIAGRAGAMQQTTGVGLSHGEAEFRAITAGFKNQVLKELSGAAVSAPEQKRVYEQLPLPTDPPEVWQAKHRQALNTLRGLLMRHRQEIGQEKEGSESKSDGSGDAQKAAQQLGIY